MVPLMSNNYKKETREHSNKAIKARANALLSDYWITSYLEEMFTYGEKEPGVPYREYQWIWNAYKTLLRPDGSSKYAWDLIKELENSIANDKLNLKGWKKTNL